jgi:hypothetical protein
MLPVTEEPSAVACSRVIHLQVLDFKNVTWKTDYECLMQDK